jgi:hypothetical protein
VAEITVRELLGTLNLSGARWETADESIFTAYNSAAKETSNG